MAASNDTTTTSSSAGGEIMAATTTPSISTTPGPTMTSDTCGCWASGATRSCFECLNTKLPSGESCVSTSSADSLRSYFNSTYPANSVSNAGAIYHDNEFYWSSNATYCQSDNFTCTGCRAQWINEFHNDSLRSNFSCVGGGGCICTAYCELRGTSNVVLPDQYNTGQKACEVGKIGWTESSASPVGMIETVLVIFGIAMIIGQTVRIISEQCRHRRQDNRLRERRRVLRERQNEIGHFGLMLTLEDWNGYKEELIDHENESLGSKSEPLLTDAPTRVVVEEGEDFRPQSPSQLARHQPAQES